MFKIVLAFDSFKESISSVEITQFLAKELLKYNNKWEIISCPLADGGEGTGEILKRSLGGNWQKVDNCLHPLPMKQSIQGEFLQVRNMAFVEMARMSGLGLISKKERNPQKTSTYGMGQVIKKIFSRNDIEEVYLALGGSATNDLGAGAAYACGWKFLDKKGEEVFPTGGNLLSVSRIIKPKNFYLFKPCISLIDVDNTLLGARGASYTFAEQKGAKKEDLPFLEDNIFHLAQLIKKDLSIDISSLLGSGAAGGFGGGSVAFFNSNIRKGIESILEITKFSEKILGTDWIIFGEGNFDKTSLQGKVFNGIIKVLKDYSFETKLSLICGKVSLSENDLASLGVNSFYSLTDYASSVKESILNPKKYLSLVLKDLVRTLM